MDKTDLYTVFLIGMFFGAALTFSTLALLANVNSEDCIACGKMCADKSVYCSNCGQKLKVTRQDIGAADPDEDKR